MRMGMGMQLGRSILGSLIAAGSTLLNDLVSYWPLNEQSGTRYDAVGDNDLTDNNTVGAVNRGPSGTVASFATNDEGLSSAATADDFPGPLAVSVWVDHTNATYAIICSNETASYYGWRILTSDVRAGGFYLQVYDGAGNVLATVQPTNAPQGWNHLMMVLDPSVTANGTLYAYLNGSPAGSAALSGTAGDPTAPGTAKYRIGAGSSIGATGRIGSVGLWHAVLSSQDVSSIFASGNGKHYADLTTAEKVGLVSYWNLDEVSGQRNDSHGTNHLTDNNTVGSVNSGPSGAVASFVAANSESLSVADPFYNTSHSISMWVYPTSLTSYHTLIAKDDGGANREYNVFLSGSYISFIYFSDTDFKLDAGKGTLALNAWNHVVITFDEADLRGRAYVNDGSANVGSAIAGPLVNAAAPLQIGTSAAAGPFDGQLGEVAVYSRVLTAGERTSLFASGNGKKYADLTTAEKVGLVSYWNLDEASGTRVDSHGSNDLTDNNTVGSVINADGAIDGAAASFVAANGEKLDVADNPSLPFGAADFSVSMWVKPTVLPTAGAYKGILLKGGASGPSDAVFVLLDARAPANGGFIVYLSDGSSYWNSGDASAVATPAVNVWSHLVISWDNTTKDLLLQMNGGTVVVTSNPGKSVQDEAAALMFGAYGGTGSFDGQLDEAAIWSRVLTEQERADLYAAGAGFFYPFTE